MRAIKIYARTRKIGLFRFASQFTSYDEVFTAQIKSMEAELKNASSIFESISIKFAFANIKQVSSVEQAEWIVADVRCCIEWQKLICVAIATMVVVAAAAKQQPQQQL